MVSLPGATTSPLLPLPPEDPKKNMWLSEFLILSWNQLRCRLGRLSVRRHDKFVSPGPPTIQLDSIRVFLFPSWYRA